MDRLNGGRYLLYVAGMREGSEALDLAGLRAFLARALRDVINGVPGVLGAL